MITAAETAHLVPRPTVIMLEGRLPVLETPAVRSLGLHDGQVVRPTVEVHDGQLRLMLQGQAIELPPTLRLAAGERPWWRVQVDAKGQWTLLPLGSAPAGGADPDGAAGLPTRLEQLALRPPGLGGLMALMQPGTLQALFQAAPQAEVRGLIAQLIGLWSPTGGRITPDALRRMVRHGGWLHESLLGRGEGGAPDAKALLRLLARQWTEASASTRALLHEAVDDIEARQLQAGADLQAGRELSFPMALPFPEGPPVQVRWKRPSRQPGQGGSRGSPWVIDLHTRSSDFGEVWLRTRVDGPQVDLTVWAERAELASAARMASEPLARWLEQEGLRLAGFQVVHGARPADGLEAPVPQAGSLVDLRA